MTLNNRQLNHPFTSQDRRECRVATHDGFIWPFARADMQTCPQSITDRMAEDMADMLHNRGADAVITEDDLLELGWNQAQVKGYGRRAARLLKPQAADPYHLEMESD